jgi:RHS repeat-associated protein
MYGAYRYGFNGKENDNEVKGAGNQQDYGMRIYDPRLGRFLSVDPLSSEFSFYSPYQFASNNPIVAIDLDGLEAVVVVTAITDKSMDNKRGQYFMYQVKIYENMTLEAYNEAYKKGKLGPPTSTALLSRDAWRKPGNNNRSSKRYGSLNETPPGLYYLTYKKSGYGQKKYQLKISDKKNGDVINGPDGTRSGIRVHQFDPHGAEGCLTCGSGNDKTPVKDFIELIPSLKTNEDVRLIIEPREVVYDPKKKIWKGIENVEKPEPIPRIVPPINDRQKPDNTYQYQKKPFIL